LKQCNDERTDQTAFFLAPIAGLLFSIGGCLEPVSPETRANQEKMDIFKTVVFKTLRFEPLY